MSKTMSLAAYAKDLPHPVNVLVQRTMGSRKEYAWVAMCLQFSIEGKAATAEEAVSRSLCNLAQYLHDCGKHKAEAFSLASDQYQLSFYTGTPMKIGTMDVEGAHIRVRVLEHRDAAWDEEDTDDSYIDLDVRSPLEETVGA